MKHGRNFGLRIGGVCLLVQLLVGLGTAQEHTQKPVADVVVDFGWTALDQPVRRKIELPNAGPDSIRIQQVSVSCDCLNILRYPDSIKAGSTGFLELLMLPDKLDEVDYRIHVEFEKSGCREIQIKGMVDCAHDPAFRGYGDLKALLKRAGLKRNYSANPDLYIDVRDLPENAVFVDIRSVSEFKQSHILRALNIQPFAVRSMAFLKRKPIVLVDAGFSGQRIEGLCGELRDAGFTSVRILAGGMASWVAQGLECSGVAVQEVLFDRVGTDQIDEIALSDEWQMIYVDSSPEMRAQVLLPCAKHIAVESTGALQARLESEMATMDQSRRLLVVTRDGSGYGPIKQILKRVGHFAYSLDGGLEAYEQRLRLLVDMEERQTVTVTSSPSGKKVSGGLGGRRVKKSCGCSG